jgi:D-glycero-alpha-D-manno-heptose-7-phosphate kinase
MMASSSVRVWAPCRVSLLGGGSDFAEFFCRDRGAVIGAGLTSGVHVRVSHASAPHANDRIADACASVLGVGGHYAFELDDTELCGAGLASSSAVVVAVLLGIAALTHRELTTARVAEAACSVEHRFLRRAGGKQDQYFAAFGGLRHISFETDGRVQVAAPDCSTETLARLVDHVLVFDTGRRRDADGLLRRQASFTDTRRREIQRMVELADDARVALERGTDPALLGALLDEAWQLKRALAPGITFAQADDWYLRAGGAGALGGKLLGAGGGGHMVFIAAPEHHDRIRRVLGNPRERRFAIGGGAHVVAQQEPAAYSREARWCHA